MMPDDCGYDAASDLPWDDDAPPPPYPVIATDPDPGVPMTLTPWIAVVDAPAHIRCQRVEGHPSTPVVAWLSRQAGAWRYRVSIAGKVERGVVPRGPRVVARGKAIVDAIIDRLTTESA